MLTNNNDLKGLVIRATDGEIGTVDQLYFDDEIWAMRYLTVETGSWLEGRKVLISPLSILQTDWKAKRIDVSLTRKQVENSPNIDTHTGPSRGSMRRSTSGITVIPTIGTVPTCGAHHTTPRGRFRCRCHIARWRNESGKSPPTRICAAWKP